MEHKACLKIILINWGGANVVWHNPPVVTYLESSYSLHYSVFENRHAMILSFPY